MTLIHADKPNSPRFGSLRRAAHAIGALLTRMALQSARPEQKSWTETLRFPPF